jgi:hypothetical protein
MFLGRCGVFWASLYRVLGCSFEVVFWFGFRVLCARFGDGFEAVLIVLIRLKLCSTSPSLLSDCAESTFPVMIHLNGRNLSFVSLFEIAITRFNNIHSLLHLTHTAFFR